MTTGKNNPRQVGRKPKTDPCRHRLSFNLNDADYAAFLTLFEESGLSDRAKFITSCIFEREIKVIRIDKAAMDYYMRLTSFHSEFRAIGVNYNQVVKHLKATFSKKMALVLLAKLEKATMELVAFRHRIETITEEFKDKYLQFANCKSQKNG